MKRVTLTAVWRVQEWTGKTLKTNEIVDRCDVEMPNSYTHADLNDTEKAKNIIDYINENYELYGYAFSECIEIL